MARTLYEALEDFRNGVITTFHTPDRVPINSSPRSYNSALSPSAGAMASVAKRQGVRVVNATAITSTPAILGQFQFNKRGGSNYHLVVSDLGRLDKVVSDNSCSQADAVTAAPFTSGTYFPDFAVANNLCFICNSQDAKKFDGSTVSPWGITKPATAPSITNVAGSGHNGTYEARVTFYNSTTGHESSAGATSATATTAGAQSLSWSSIPTATAGQGVTARRLYVRNTSTQAYFYLAGSVNDNTTTTATTSVADTALITRGPDTTENDPPITGIRYAKTHLARVFVADQQKLYYSKIDLPEAFDPDSYISVNPDDGQLITGLLSFAGQLLIFKTDAVYALVGDTPDNWVVELIDPIIGCVSHRSITVAEGIARWWSEHLGPVEMTSTGRPTAFAMMQIGPTIAATNIDQGQLGLICSAVDFANERVLFSVPGLSQTRNTFFLPYNYRLRVWESDRWESIDACSLASVDDSTGISWLFTGGYKGQLFRWWDSTTDGVASGTKSGTVTSTDDSTHLSDSGAAFVTAGGGLVERYVIAIDPALTKIQRRRITANTGTRLTVTPAWTDIPTSAWTYVVGGIDFQFDTEWLDGSAPFSRKRYRFLYVLCSTTSASLSMTANLYFNYTTDGVKTLTVTNTSAGGIWDTSLWDTGIYSSVTAAESRYRVAHKARTWKLRLRNYVPDVDVTVHKVGMQSEVLTDQDAT